MSQIDESTLRPIYTPDPPCIMRSIPNWVVWGWWERDGSKVKMPYNPKTGRAAKTNSPDTWGTYQESLYRFRRNPSRYTGLGFIFSEGTGLFGIDLDGCVDNLKLSPWAVFIMSKFKTYTELSPSGTGVKMFGIGTVPTGMRLRVKVKAEPVGGKSPGIEIYGRARLFCFTGQRVSMQSQIHDCSNNLDKLLKKIQPTENQVQVVRNNTRRDGRFEVNRARRWLRKHGPAVSGQFGHTHTYTAALTLVDRFGLDQSTALDLLREWNESCVPPWTDRELIRKLKQVTRR
jgi:primase-polymerase (primpol)-like protein